MNKVVINQLPVEKLRGKRVFLRIDLGAEQMLSGAFLDDSKLRASLPTIEYLIGAGARIIIGAHLGETFTPCFESLRLDPVAERLSELLKRPVRKLNDMVGRDVLSAVLDMRDGDLLLLENLFFYPGELNNDAEFAHELGRLADIYCNDAFALSNRGLASTVGITRYIRPAVAGLAMARDITMLEAVSDKVKQPFVGVIAGARIEEKLPILENLLPKLNRLFIGGALAFTFLKARGQDVGAAYVDQSFLPLAEKLLRKAEGKVEIVLPQDFTVVNADEFGAYEKERQQLVVPPSRHVLGTEIMPSDLPVDIGPLSVNRLKELLDGAHTIFWNGPLGMWQIKPFHASTLEIAKYFVENGSQSDQLSILCGDSLARAIRSFNLPVERIRHLMSGGESAMQLLAGNPLPAISALDDNTSVSAPVAKRRRILFPVDGSPHSLEAARQLGWFTGAEDTEITLLHVWKPPYFGTEETWDEEILYDPEIKRRYKVEQRFEAERIFALVNATLASQGLISRRQFMVEGDPADQILKFADEMKPDLIAMGSHGRTGLLRFLMGSVSRKVLDHAKCQVLIVRIPDEELAKAGLLEAA